MSHLARARELQVAESFTEFDLERLTLARARELQEAVGCVADCGIQSHPRTRTRAASWIKFYIIKLDCMSHPRTRTRAARGGASDNLSTASASHQPSVRKPGEKIGGGNVSTTLEDTGKARDKAGERVGVSAKSPAIGSPRSASASAAAAAELRHATIVRCSGRLSVLKSGKSGKSEK